MVCRNIHVMALLVLSLTARTAVGQAGSGDLTGVVSDSGGAVLPAAKVTATDMGTGWSAGTTSSSGGVYVFTNLHPGVYTVTAEATGFQKLERSGITLITGERTRLDLKMAVGKVTESITVAGDAPLLQTETASLTQSIDHQKVVELPLNGRTFIQLATLSPGVMLPPGTLLPRINGGRPRTNEYLFDGITVLQPEPGQVAFFPVIDAIQEFKIESNSGRPSSAGSTAASSTSRPGPGRTRFHGDVLSSSATRR